MGKDNENENAASVLTTRNNVITQVVTDDDDDFEIDFMELFFMFRQHILMLILAFLVGGGLGYAVSKFVLTPTYTSTSMIYVMSKETTLTSLADLQIGSQLTEDYKVLVTSRTVMEDVIKKLSLDMDYYDLRKKITLDNPNNTRILNISVLDTDPQRAKRLTDAVADSASDYIADIMEQDPPKIIEYGEIPLRRPARRPAATRSLWPLCSSSSRWQVLPSQCLPMTRSAQRMTSRSISTSQCLRKFRRSIRRPRRRPPATATTTRGMTRTIPMIRSLPARAAATATAVKHQIEAQATDTSTYIRVHSMAKQLPNTVHM